MSAAIIDGKAIAADLRAAVKAETARLRAAHGIVPGLAVVLIGEDPASQSYVAANRVR
jgi:methylenetetrahydrofolate dehydrogenase (NADP+)/methenyltetrahydrofolate cyclohydrolase